MELRSYFTDLCQSITNSMIHDPEQISVRVTVGDSVSDGDTSVSLGLIVTELMINALKHAFPDGRQGKISVDYRAQGSDWTLSVGDNGVGMSTEPGSAKPGLGTSIVSALAHQLHAGVHISDSHPGHKVSIIHEPADVPVA